MTIKNNPNYSIVNRKNPQKVQKLFCNNFLQWGNYECYFDWINNDYPFLHSHEYWEMFIVTEGSITHLINGESKVIKKGDACLIRPKDMHELFFQNKCNGNIELINFIMKSEWIESFFEMHKEGLSKEALKSEDVLYFNIDKISVAKIKRDCLQIQLLNPNKNDECKVFLKLIIEQMLKEFINQRVLLFKENPEWLDELILYLNNPKSFTKSILEISATTPYSYSRLSHIFKEYFMISMIDYRNQIKLEYSKKLLLDSRSKIISISSVLGFNSLSHYNHLFKKYYGITPSQYKKETLNNI